RPAHVAGAGAGAPVLPGQVAGAVLEVGREHLVAGPKPQRARDDVDARRGVVDERQLLRPGAEEGGERRARLVEQPLEPAAEELDRLPLELALPGEPRLE